MIINDLTTQRLITNEYLATWSGNQVGWGVWGDRNPPLAGDPSSHPTQPDLKHCCKPLRKIFRPASSANTVARRTEIKKMKKILCAGNRLIQE